MRVSPIALALVFAALVILLIIWQRNSGWVKSITGAITVAGDKIEAAVNKLGLSLIAEWRRFYTMYSIWFYAALGTAPDLYNLAVSSGVIDGASTPVVLTRIINTIAFIGAASRLVQQKKLTNAREAAEAKAAEGEDSARL